MSVTSKPKRSDQFVEQAPDAAQPQGLRRGRRRQITVTMPDELLAELDHAAARNGLSRAGALNQAAKRWIEQEG